MVATRGYHVKLNNIIINENMTEYHGDIIFLMSKIVYF